MSNTNEIGENVQDGAWVKALQSLDWQPIDDSHKDGRSLVLRSNGQSYDFAYWGPNQEEWGWPADVDDADHKWRLAGDCRVGEPLAQVPIEAAEPTEFVRSELGEY